MEVTPAESSGRQIVSHQESISSESSQSESTKQVGNKKIAEKSSSFSSEELSATVEQSNTQSVSRVVQSSVSSSKEDVIKEESNELELRVENEAGEIPGQSKALELITKYIEDPSEAERPVEEVKPDAEVKQEVGSSEEKKLINRQTSTTSLEDDYLKRLSEKHFQNIQNLLLDTLPAEMFEKPKRAPSVEPTDLLHLVQSIQIAQELNRFSRSEEKENERSENADITNDENSTRENKPIDLEKLFTPASDSGEITPAKNRKMFASSSFYSPIHPTVEDQVQLARRISSSLCDISNKQSKGQSMYVNRMKRSVKWVHGGGENETLENGVSVEENNLPAFKIPNVGPKEMKLNAGKDPLKLIMNPHGKIQDINSLSKQGQQIQAPLTPEKCFDLVRDLNTTKGKGAELFAKRRKRSEKWVVDETNVKQTTTTNVSSTSISEQQRSSMTTEKTYLQNTTRQDQIKKINEIQERFSQPRLKLIKSPWEAALETGSVDTAFQDTGPVFPTANPYTPLERLPTPARATPINEGVQKQALLLPNIPRGWGSAQTRQLTYGSVKLNPADPPIASKDAVQTSLSASTTVSGTAFLNQSHTSNTHQHLAVRSVRGPQEPLARSSSPLPSVFIPHPKTTSPPRDIRRLIHPESLRPKPVEEFKVYQEENVAEKEICSGESSKELSEVSQIEKSIEVEKEFVESKEVKQEITQEIKKEIETFEDIKIEETKSEIVKTELGNQTKQLNIDEEIQNIDSEIQSLTREMNTQEMFDNILSEENKFIRAHIPTSIVNEIIAEELSEKKRLEAVLNKEEEVKKSELKKQKECEEWERIKKEEYQKLLLQQEQLKLTPYQIQAREEKHKMKMKHLDETRELQTAQQEEMRKMKTEHAQQIADLTLRQQKQNKVLTQAQMTEQLEEMNYLQKLQRQKLCQEQFLQMQRIRQKHKVEEKELQEKLDALDFAIQEEFIRQQEEEKRLLEQKRYEEEMRRIKEEQERLLQLEKEREAVLKIEKEKFLQEIYREQCLKMIKEQGVMLTAEEMVEFLLSLGIEVSLEQVEKMSANMAEEREALQREQQLMREEQERLRQEEEERIRIEEQIFNEKQKAAAEIMEQNERKVSTTDPPKWSEEVPELSKLKDEAEVEEYVHQKTLQHKQEIEKKQTEDKQLVEEIAQCPQPEENTEETSVIDEQKERHQKPAALVPGAVPIFGGDFTSKTNVLLHEEMQKKSTKKGSSEVNEVTTDDEVTESGVVYESKQFRELVETFEGSSRPVEKLKYITDNPEILKSISGVNINESIHTEIVQQTSSDTFYEAQCSTENKRYSQELNTCGSRTVSRTGSTSRQSEMQVVHQLSELLRHSEPPLLEPVHRPYSGLAMREPTPLPPVIQPQPISETPQPVRQEPPLSYTPSRYLDFTSLNNYNTAPRGWKQNSDYYRPVTFTPSTKLPNELIYTDY